MKKTAAIVSAFLAAGSASSALAGGDIEAGRIKGATCAVCHGKQGISSNPSVPNIAGQTKGYLAKSLREFRSGQRKDPSMNRIAERLSDADIADLSTYYASLPR